MNNSKQDIRAAIFEAGSEQNHIAFEHLAELLKDIGFSVRKKNGNWRLTFEFRDGHAYVLDYEDYH